jgi:hypothetical protein
MLASPVSQFFQIPIARASSKHRTSILITGWAPMTANNIRMPTFISDGRSQMTMSVVNSDGPVGIDGDCGKIHFAAVVATDSLA